METSEKSVMGGALEMVRGEIAAHEKRVKGRYERLWAYYRNPMVVRAAEERRGFWGGVRGQVRDGRWYELAQEVGLPARLMGASGRVVMGPGSSGVAAAQGRSRERVIENDIAWRVQTMVDFMFGKPVVLLSAAADAKKREVIRRVLDAVWQGSGGVSLLQDAALLGSVYGSVDLLVRVDDALFAQGAEAGGAVGVSDLRRIAELVRIEVVEPRRGVAKMRATDYRELDAYAVLHGLRGEGLRGEGVREVEMEGVEPRGWIGRVMEAARKGAAGVGVEVGGKREEVVEVLTAEGSAVFVGERLVRESGARSRGWSGGVVPVVHVQNIAQPFAYDGMSEVEPLIPLQDELNTRLSDRANRVTMQSFRMYLAKGMEGAGTMEIGPGVVWTTENQSAQVQAFGGDAACPSEEQHIREIREAMDKVSGIPPIASGVVQAKIGNLSSANALRVTLMGILSKTARKRLTYGRGIQRVSQLVLAALDHAGVLKTEPEEREIVLEWPDPLPEDERERVFVAEAKLRLGVPKERILAELGYGPGDAGVM